MAALYLLRGLAGSLARALRGRSFPQTWIHQKLPFLGLQSQLRLFSVLLKMPLCVRYCSYGRTWIDELWQDQLAAQRPHLRFHAFFPQRKVLIQEHQHAAVLAVQ